MTGRWQPSERPADDHAEHREVLADAIADTNGQQFAVDGEVGAFVAGAACRRGVGRGRATA
jgi:hypothetical protein